MAGSVDHDPSSYVENTMRTSIAVGQQKDELRSMSWMIAFLRLPNILSSYAICITIKLWLFRLSWPCLRHLLAVKGIIPQDSSFVKSCVAGDVEEVRCLAFSGQGMPSNLDEAGRPILHVLDPFNV